LAEKSEKDQLENYDKYGKIILKMYLKFTATKCKIMM